MQFFLTLLRFVLLGLNLFNFVVLPAYSRQVSTSNKGKIEEDEITSQAKNKKKKLCFKLELNSKDKIAKKIFSPDMCANCPFRDICL